MFEQKSLAATLLANPLAAQAYALEEFENRNDGNIYVADANNVFGFLLEYGASLNNITCQTMFEAFRKFYPKRAQTMEDLMLHMSDWDYLNLYSTPCTCSIRLTLNRKYLVENAISFNDNYKLVIIPKYTVFTVGRYQFGIHYPIHLRINKLTNTILATWDADISNPLHTLSQNLVTTVEEDYSGLELLHIEIPTHQFFFSIQREDLIAKTGFIKKYKYNNKFWAVRIWTIKDGEYIELSQVLTKVVYDVNKPTACILVDPDQKQFTVNIPQIYFTNGLMGSKLYMEVYTSYGALDDDLSAVSTDAISCSFNLNLPNVSPYSKILKTNPTISVLPLQTKLVGGGNGYGMEELRDRVINQNFYKPVPITPANIEKYLSDNGFGVIKYLDNITDRVYHAHQVLTDNDGEILPTTNAGVNISEETIQGVSSIIVNPDGTYTIMPSTLYSYDDTSLISTPLTDIEVNELSKLTKSELVSQFNNGTYTSCPFHIHLMNSDRYPKAVSYNLVSCKTKGLTFIKSNDEVAPQIVVYGASIVHNENGTKGYTVELIVSKSKDMKTIPEDQIYVYVSTYTPESHVAGIRATFDREQDVFSIYKFTIETDYWINSEGRLNITNFESSNIVQPFMMDLEAPYYITTMVSKEYLPASNNDIFNYVADLEQAVLDKYVVLLRQSIVLHLGHSLSDVVSNDINITLSPIEYEKYPEDVYLTYDQDVYERDSEGNLVFTFEDNKPKLHILHTAGEVITNDLGDPYIKYKSGQIRYDDFGKPIEKKDRIITYQVNMMQFDARIYLSEDPTHITFRNTLPATLESYFTTLRAIQNQLIERTNIYFRPTRTFGTCRFSMGNGVTKRYELAMKFHVKYYIHSYVDTDQAILDNIKNVTISEITSQLKNKRICMTTIFKQIKDKLSDYIVDVDILGINDTTELQTLVVAESDKDAQPILAQKLILDRSEQILLEHDITIDYAISDI